MIWTVEDIISWMNKINEKMQTNKRELTLLDQKIGDGDHGINMSRGFEKAVGKLNHSTYDNVTEALKEVAMAIISNVGGASGPLYGTAFLRLSLATKNIQTIDSPVFANGITAAIAGMKQRGRVTTGEKTLIDVWEVVEEYLTSVDEIDTDKLKQVAEDAMNKTKAMRATKGRASYLKERSIGHIDPGAMSSYLIFVALAEVIERRKTA